MKGGVEGVLVELPAKLRGPECRIVGLLVVDIEREQLHICPLETGCTGAESLAMIAKFLPEVSTLL